MGVRDALMGLFVLLLTGSRDVVTRYLSCCVESFVFGIAALLSSLSPRNEVEERGANRR